MDKAFALTYAFIGVINVGLGDIMCPRDTLPVGNGGRCGGGKVRATALVMYVLTTAGVSARTTDVLTVGPRAAIGG